MFENDDEHSDIYEDRNRTIQTLNRDSLSVPAAFNRYLREKGLIPEGSPLKWIVSGEVVEIGGTRGYAEMIADPSCPNRSEYLAIFDDYNCKNYFERPDGGRYKKNQKSLLVYEWTGRFMMFREDRPPLDLGYDLLSHLTDCDEMVSARHEFLMRSVLQDTEFTKRIESDTGADLMDLIMEEDEDGYDMLCCLDYLLSSKKELRYKSLTITDNEKGIRYITRIVADAYAKRDGKSLRRYEELKDLAHHTELCTVLPYLKNATISCVSRKGETVGEIHDILGYIDRNTRWDRDGTPGIDFYLICAISLGGNGMSIPLVFNNHSGTLKELVRDVVKDGDIDGFLRDIHIRRALDFIINLNNDSGFEGFRKESSDKFNEIYSKIAETNENIDRLLQEAPSRRNNERNSRRNGNRSESQ